MDAIVYGVVVSLGFATLENYDYVFRLAEEYKMSPLEMAIGRAYTAVPMHALCGLSWVSILGCTHLYQAVKTLVWL